MYRSLADLAASESTRIGAPLTRWESLAPALLADGVIDDGRVLAARASRRARRPWLQAAAAVLFIAGGMMAGRYTAGASRAANRRKPATVASRDGHQSAVPVGRARRVRFSRSRRRCTKRRRRFSRSRTRRAARRTAPSAIRTRLAAIEQTQDVMGEALKKAPYDAVINGYYLSTLGQREATLRQLNSVMPASMKITRY